MHPFQSVATGDPTAENFRRLLDDEHCTFHSPILQGGVDDPDIIAVILEAAHATFGTPTYPAELSDDKRTVVQFTGCVDGDDLEATVDLQPAEGRIRQLRVYLRPLPVVERFATHMDRRRPHVTDPDTAR